MYRLVKRKYLQCHICTHFTMMSCCGFWFSTWLDICKSNPSSYMYTVHVHTCTYMYCTCTRKQVLIQTDLTWPENSVNPSWPLVRSRPHYDKTRDTCFSLPCKGNNSKGVKLGSVQFKILNLGKQSLTAGKVFIIWSEIGGIVFQYFKLWRTYKYNGNTI